MLNISQESDSPDYFNDSKGFRTKTYRKSKKPSRITRHPEFALEGQGQPEQQKTIVKLARNTVGIPLVHEEKEAASSSFDEQHILKNYTE